jgi:hypothetical protein
VRPKTCPVCSAEFVPSDSGVNTCSIACGQIFRVRKHAAASPAPVLKPAPKPPAPAAVVPPLVSKSKMRWQKFTPKPRVEAERPRTHLVIPDTQVKPGASTDHLEWIGRYIAVKRPDVIVMIGDFADMPSLSSYDKGKKSFEGRRYMDDIMAARAGMERLTAPFRDIKGYAPRMELTLGNHEDRITRAVNDAAILEGTIGLKDLGYEAFGWNVRPYLEIIRIDGIAYSHYFTTGVMGRPVSSAAALMREVSGSGVMGHVQYTDLAFHKKTQRFGLLAGICYLHDEDYLGPQGNQARKQIVMLHEVEDGRADPMFVSLAYLERKFGRAA